MSNKEKLNLTKEAILELQDYNELLKLEERLKTDLAKNELKNAYTKMLNSATEKLEKNK